MGGSAFPTVHVPSAHPIHLTPGYQLLYASVIPRCLCRPVPFANVHSVHKHFSDAVAVPINAFTGVLVGHARNWGLNFPFFLACKITWMFIYLPRLLPLSLRGLPPKVDLGTVLF